MTTHTLTRAEVEAQLQIERRGLSATGELTLGVSGWGRSFRVVIELREGAASVSDKTVQALADLQALSPEAVVRIRELMFEDLQRASHDHVGYVPLPPPAPPPGFWQRLFWRAPPAQFVEIPLDDPRHPCHLAHGIASLDAQIDWQYARIDENEATEHRFVLLDAITCWEPEHGVTVVIRDGAPCAVADYFVDLAEYDDDHDGA
ncbi:hypothetical protein [Roseateles paludis]|jgi:hypothetical protein|uniref:Uncharacterized protein n=1 Tax=Roseateles paludis TaxID=3145238 RepID=A0ABV0FZD3_9BURK